MSYGAVPYGAVPYGTVPYGTVPCIDLVSAFIGGFISFKMLHGYKVNALCIIRQSTQV